MCCSEDSLDMLVLWFELECELQALEQAPNAIREAA